MMVAKRVVVTCMALAMMLAAFAASAAEPVVAPAKVTPELAPDPKVTEIVNGLGEGQSAMLPAFRVTGDINDVARKWNLDKTGPTARDYCIKWVWMPDRKRAIFCGANHGAPHRLNDVWEYDLPSNTWVCLYGPDPSRDHRPENWKDVETKDGIFRSKRGGPANVGHTWWQLTYDPEKKAMLWLCRWGQDPEFAVKLRQQGGGIDFVDGQPPLWAFYPETRRWEPLANPKFEGAEPRYNNASALQYVPELKGTVWVKSLDWMGPGTWVYDSASNTWRDLKANNRKMDGDSPGNEGVVTWVPDRKILVGCSEAGKGGRTTHFDIAANTWKRTVEGAEVPRGHDAKTPFDYDTVGKVCLLREGATLWAYDPGETKWTKLQPKGPPPPGGKAMGYYDPERNVFVVNEWTTTWVYRHKSAAK